MMGVREVLQSKLNKVEIADKLHTLIRYQETGARYATSLAPLYFEDIVTDGLLGRKLGFGS
jgi:hypothetical protein